MDMRKRGARKRKTEEALEREQAGDTTEEKLDRRRKRCGSKKYIGAHVSIKGGIWKAVENCTEMGGSSFALFLGSQLSWQRAALDQKAAAKFREQCTLQGFDPAHILPHGPYLLNCGSPKDGSSDTRGWLVRALTMTHLPADFNLHKSQALLVNELSRCSLLGLSLYNFHPGSSLGIITTNQCVDKIASTINHAHSETSAVVTVLENMSGQGSTVGGKFSELKSIIDRVRDQTRVGVCLDTCHAFAAGYDLAAEGGVKAMLDEFDREVGLHYLRAIHLNDSKGKLGCHLDLHEDIGKGHIGISAFQDIVNEPRLDNIPMILETPGRPGFAHAEQIELLYSLCEKK